MLGEQQPRPFAREAAVSQLERELPDVFRSHAAPNSIRDAFSQATDFSEYHGNVGRTISVSLSEGNQFSSTAISIPLESAYDEHLLEEAVAFFTGNGENPVLVRVEWKSDDHLQRLKDKIASGTLFTERSLTPLEISFHNEDDSVYRKRVFFYPDEDRVHFMHVEQLGPEVTEFRGSDLPFTDLSVPLSRLNDPEVQVAISDWQEGEDIVGDIKITSLRKDPNGTITVAFERVSTDRESSEKWEFVIPEKVVLSKDPQAVTS